MDKTKYQVVIGLEVHAQLLTNSKLFCADATNFGGQPNTQISVISLAHPGTLPVMNEKVIELAVKLGLAMNCSIVQENYFARKNYFYPDLPKGYQISQHTAPICEGGELEVETTEGKRKIQLNRIHIEEDAGKSIHDISDEYSCIDLNRAGMPLLEIVTEPNLHSADEAFNYLTNLRKLVRWLGVCDGNMEEGSMRCDANISIRPMGATYLGKRVEVKNLNSIRNVKRAIDVEVDRLIAIVEKGEEIKQETRSYDADNNITFSLRSKEDADDYRYFPEPDLPSFYISHEYISSIKNEMPELPFQKFDKLMNNYQLSEYDATTLTAEKEDVEMFEAISSLCPNYKAIANWMPVLKQYCADQNLSIQQFPLSVPKIADLIQYTESGKVSFNVASTKILAEMISDVNSSAEQIATKLNLVQESDENTLVDWVETVLKEMPDKVKEYQKGKKGLLGLFAGEVKKKSKGKADMQIINKILLEKLNQL